MADLDLSKTTVARRLAPLLLLALNARPGLTAELPGNITFGGSLAFTSDSIYRGVSESDGHEAIQLDLHADRSGTFLGAWGSTRDHNLDPYGDYDLEVYLGHRFDLSTTWSATLAARSRYFVGGDQEGSIDYQEIAGSLTYLDRWSFSLAALPNAVHYWYEERVGRSASWIADTTGQWLLDGRGFFLTGGAGYFYAGRTGPGIAAGGGYVYGNAGVAFEHGRWRIDAGYFATGGKARQLTPYPVPHDHIAGTLVWRF
ncbi:MAG: hypothetical protein JO361_11655 [Gammaproteobacteria bacterium]|nr:hypothetical protein [Gammaproteobacteria bacterium]